MDVAIGYVLGWRIRLEGERFLIAIVRPPADITMRSLRGWASLPELLLFTGVELGAISATYSLLSHITLAR